jgi:hypothetical protein
VKHAGGATDAALCARRVELIVVGSIEERKAMGANGNGDSGNREGARPTYEEARAAFGEPRDRVDRVALFAVEQSEALLQAFKLQSEGMLELIALLNERFRLLEAEIAKLKAERRGEPPEDERGSLQ